MSHAAAWPNEGINLRRTYSPLRAIRQGGRMGELQKCIHRKVHEVEKEKDV